MIEKVTFAVGSNDIETITGEQLQIKNELMTSDEMRLGHEHGAKALAGPFGRGCKMLSQGGGRTPDRRVGGGEGERALLG